MNKDQMRIKIAEACGWTFIKQPRSNMMSKAPAWHLISPKGKVRCGKYFWVNTLYGKESVYRAFQGELADYLDECSIPDYLNDLNAMHEAEKVLTQDKRTQLVNVLLCVVIKDLDRNTPMVDKLRVLYYATAAQRAEAFLRTLNLWNQ